MDTTPYAALWSILRADQYRCRYHRDDGRLCRRPTRNVARDPATGRLRAYCRKHIPRQESTR